MVDIFNKDTAENINRFRKNIRETRKKELIRQAIRGRSFSGIDTLLQGINLINFSLQARRMTKNENSR